MYVAPIFIGLQYKKENALDEGKYTSAVPSFLVIIRTMSDEVNEVNFALNSNTVSKKFEIKTKQKKKIARCCDSFLKKELDYLLALFFKFWFHYVT